jgi:adenylosuccinate lyase
MIPRYTPPEFRDLWSNATRYQTWLEIELAACEAMEHEKLVPAGTATSLRAKKLVLDPDRIDEIERTTRHDVIAFLTHVEELAGPEARWLHRGMTSSDVLDTSLALLLVPPMASLSASTSSSGRSTAARPSTGRRR